MRVTNAVVRHRKHKKLLSQAKGFRGRSHTCYRVALQAVRKSWTNAYRDRRLKKSDFRSLWIQRINGEVRKYGLRYGIFMNALKKKGIDLNRKVLAQLAFSNKELFQNIVEQAKTVL